MSQPPLFIALVAALVINTLSCCSAAKVYCVIPTTTLCSTCPHSSSHCATLSEYAQKVKLYFTSNTTIVFLPGDHILNTNISVANITGLVMHGVSSSGIIATVVCNGTVGFSFIIMLDLKIASLSFTGYSNHRIENTFKAHAALFLSSTSVFFRAFRGGTFPP